MPRLLHSLVVLASGAFIATLIVVVALRVSYPYELEWLEGMMLDSVRRILAGHSLYGPPTLEFVPSVYNPVYFHLSAVVARVMGLGFAPLRLVSVVSTIALLTLLIFRLSATSRMAGFVAAGLYAASYRFSGSWMDIAKSDSLFLAVLLAAFLIGRDARAAWQHVLSGLLYVLALFTKQTTLAVLAILFVGQLLLDWRRHWLQWLTFGLLSAGVFATLDWTTDGWYSYYTLDSPLHFEANPDALYFLVWGRLKLMPLFLATAVFVATLAARRWRPSLIGKSETLERADPALLNTVILGIALAGSSWAVFRQRGTFDNVFLPACLGLAICGGLAYEDFRRAVHERNGRSAERQSWDILCFGAVAVLVLQQFLVYVYNPMAQVPTQADRAAGDQFISQLRSLPGDVLVWAHGSYGVLAGKNPHLQATNFEDAAGWTSVAPRTDDNRRRRQQVGQLIGEIHKQPFEWVVLDGPGSIWMPYYLEAARVPVAPRVLTGRATRPQQLLAKNPIATGGRLDVTDARLNFLFGSGWGPPEAWGRPLVGDDATVAIALARGGPYQLQIGLQVPCGSAAGGAAVAVWWNGGLLDQKALAECGPHALIAALGAETLKPDVNTLRLDVMSPGKTTANGPLGMTSLNVIPSAARTGQ